MSQIESRTEQIKPLITSDRHTLAENYRSDPSGRGLAPALQLTTEIIFPGNIVLTGSEVHELVDDSSVVTTFLGLFRIHEDALGSKASMARNPRESIAFLESALDAMEAIGHNEYVQNILEQATQAQYAVQESQERERLQLLSSLRPEIERDFKKLIQAGASLFLGRRNRELMMKGEEVLERAKEMLPAEHPTRDLIDLEIGLSKIARHVSVDEILLYRSLAGLYNKLHGQNDHRVATMASKVMVNGSTAALRTVAEYIYIELINEHAQDHPEWVAMRRKEISRKYAGPIRNGVFAAVALFTIPQRERDELFSRLR